MTATATKGQLGAQDLHLPDGTTNRTFSRPTSMGGVVTLNDATYEIDALISYGGGLNYTQATIAAALTAIGTSNKATLLLRPGTWVISSNADWSSYTNVTFKIVPGAILQIATGTTTTFGGPLEAGLYQVFTGNGTAVFGNKTTTAHPEWWGFAESASAAVNATALQAAYDSLASRITLPAGLFEYDTGLVFIRGSLTFKGAGGPAHHDLPAGSHPQTTILEYTGNGVAITLQGVGANGSYNMHLSDFLLVGNINATGGILVGTSDTTPILLSSLKNITVDSFQKDGVGYGIKIRRAQQTIFENVYAHQNYYGWLGTDGLNTTLTFTNCHSISNLTYGWLLDGSMTGSSLYQCLAESNGNAGLYIYGSGMNTIGFYNWHSESNNTGTGTAPNIINGSAVVGAPININFFGGYFGDSVGGLVWDIGYADRVTWNYITMPSYSGSMQVTANTTYSVFNHWDSTLTTTAITNNALGRVFIPTLGITAWIDYSAASTVTGWAAGHTALIYYKIVNGVMLIRFDITGTSNNIFKTFSVPYTSLNLVDTKTSGYGLDNGTGIAGGVLIFNTKNTGTIQIASDMLGQNAWTASGTAQVVGMIEIPIALK